MSMATYSSHTLPSRGGGGGGRFYSGSAGLMEKIHEMLTERECSIFNEGLAAYHKRRDVSRFVESLSLVLNTNGKRQLLVPIRNQFIKPSDLIKFNDLSIKYGIALPLKGNTAKSGKKMFNKTQTGPKVLEIKRDEKGEWGFSIRGGIDHGIGIFVSWVDRGSNAERAGLKVGDYIHRVNEVGLEGLTFAQATQIFRNRSKIRMVITSYGRIPGFQFANKSFRWVDREGKPVLPPTEIESLGMTSGGHVDPNVRKVSFTVEAGQVLGVSIRGGAEHGLGIYISEVDAGSVAATNGIKRGEQILEVNGISYINILHPDAAKGLKEERVMTMRLKDVGKLPHSKIPPVVPQTWQQEPSVAASHTTRSMRSLPGTMKKGTEYTDSSKPAEGTGGTPVMITKRALTPGRGIMNEVAESLLTKSEMTTFTYYITRYEHNQISVESLVESLLKLLNTEKKMSLIGEVRNIIREKDLDLFNELTAQKELQSFRASKSLYDDSDDDMAAVHAINGIKTPQKGFNDDDSLDDVPQRFQTFPITIHPPPPPPPREGDTSTPHFIATSMKDRRRNLHESIMEDDSWEDSTLPRPLHTNTVDDDTMKRKMKEIEEKTKLELEAQLKKEYEEQLAEKLRAEQEEIERIKEEMRLEKEAMEKQLQGLSAKEGEESITDKEKLEEEIWKQAEESLRQELKDQIEKESEQKLKEEYDKLLETSLAEERKKTEAERKMREELEKKQREKNVIEREREEQKRIEIEDRARRDAEDKARREYEQRLQRESEEKARLAEEIKSYRSIKMEMESERDQKERLEKAKKNAERKAEEEEAEKEKIRKKLKKEKEEAEERAEKEEAEKRKIEKQLKREKEDAEEKAEKEAAEKLKLKALLEKKEKELEEKEREAAEREAALKAKQKKEKVKQQQVKPVQQVIRKEPETKEESEDEEEEGMDEDEEEELRRQEEEELRRQEEEEERRREEERQREEKRKQQERKKAKQEEERRKRQQERELARQAEEERKRRMREEEEKQQREEEQRRQREEEQRRQREEEEERRQREEEEEERHREEEERKRMEERRLSKEGSFFDPVLMDELVISSLPTQAPAPTGGSSASSRPHVTFQDQKQKEQKIIENERKLAEQMLSIRLRERKNESKEEEGRFSFAGYTNLKGTMTKVTVKKVNKKLGIAVDGGSNTKQKAVIVRQIVADGSAAMTGKDLEIGQQILAVNGKSLKGLKHKDAVLAIKNAFDGPMQKVIEFDMLIPDTS